MMRLVIPALMLCRAGAATPPPRPTLNGEFCADMFDSTLVNGTAVPTLEFNYTLCVSQKRTSWSRVDKGKGELIFNSTHLITISDGGRLGRACTVAPATAPDPLSAPPFSFVDLPDDASMDGAATVDGVRVTVWRAHVAADPLKKTPAADVAYYANAEAELVRLDSTTRDPWTTDLRTDFFARGAYSTTVPDGAFLPPAGLDCK